MKTTLSEIEKNFRIFTETISGKLIMPRRSEIDSGGALKYLTVEVIKENENSVLKLNQTFSYFFSDPENLVIITGLTCKIEKKVNVNYNLSFWEKGLFERMFKTNWINSGNMEFDKKYSAKSSDFVKTSRLFLNKEVQKLFLDNSYLIFNVKTENAIMTIKLKDNKHEVYTSESMMDLIKSMIEIEQIIK